MYVYLTHYARGVRFYCINTDVDGFCDLRVIEALQDHKADVLLFRSQCVKQREIICGYMWVKFIGDIALASLLKSLRVYQSSPLSID